MYIKINDTELPFNFTAIAAIGIDNRKYVDILGEITGPNYIQAKRKLDDLLDLLNVDDNTIYINSDRDGIKAKREVAASVINGFEQQPFTFMVKMFYRCEDKIASSEIFTTNILDKSGVVLIEGNADSYPIITVSFTGGSTSLTISNDATDQTFSIDDEFEDGDILVVDSVERELKKNDLIMIEESETAEFIKLVNGRNNITVTADADAGVSLSYSDKIL